LCPEVLPACFRPLSAMPFRRNMASVGEVLRRRLRRRSTVAVTGCRRPRLSLPWRSSPAQVCRSAA